MSYDLKCSRVFFFLCVFICVLVVVVVCCCCWLTYRLSVLPLLARLTVFFIWTLHSTLLFFLQVFLSPSLLLFRAPYYWMVDRQTLDGVDWYLLTSETLRSANCEGVSIITIIAIILLLLVLFTMDSVPGQIVWLFGTTAEDKRLGSIQKGKGN